MSSHYSDYMLATHEVSVMEHKCIPSLLTTSVVVCDVKGHHH